MTVLIGLRCSDGIVIGADSSATFGPHLNARTIEQKVQKVFVVEGKIIIAGTGQVGLGQRFKESVERAFKEKKLGGVTGIQVAKQLSSVGQADFAETQVNKGQYGALVAFPVGTTPHLCELSANDFQPEMKTDDMWFASMGSGQPITDPFLGLMRRVFFKESVPTLREGIFLTAWALSHTIELNPGGINGPSQIATLSTDAGRMVARLLDDDELEEHQNSVDGAEKHLCQYREILTNGSNCLPAVIKDVPVAPMEAALQPRIGGSVLPKDSE